MNEIRVCNQCQGFIPEHRQSCPNCATEEFSIPAPIKGAFTLVAGSVMAVTLSACYGSPCAGSAECGLVVTPMDVCDSDDAIDADEDGFCAEVDCDDNDPDVFPGAWDTSDEDVPNDCNAREELEDEEEETSARPEDASAGSTGVGLDQQ